MAALTAFAWYSTAEDYFRVYAISADQDRLPKSFTEWRERAQKQVDDLGTRGVQVTKVMVNPQALADWATAQRREVDSKCRSQFAALTLANRQHAH